MNKRGWFKRFCEWGARRLLRRLHRITQRMPAELRRVQPGRVLVVAPHMDDEVIGPGGTLALHREAGSAIGVVYVSDGATAGAPAGPHSGSRLVRGRVPVLELQRQPLVSNPQEMLIACPTGRVFDHDLQLAVELGFGLTRGLLRELCRPSTLGAKNERTSGSGEHETGSQGEPVAGGSRRA